MEIKVHYFAAIRERLQRAQEQIELPETEHLSVASLWTLLCARHPELSPIQRHVRLSVNLEFVDDNTRIVDGDEVALIPPVAGGHDGPQRLSDAPLSLQDVIDRVTHDAAGAVVSFTGVVRDHSLGRAVSDLEYEVYPDMAIAKLTEVEREVESTHPGTRCAICHRHGALRVGDAAVVIAVSSPHRAEAFRACEQAINRIKEIVPIWKKETGPDGSSWVGMGS